VAILITERMRGKREGLASGRGPMERPAFRLPRPNPVVTDGLLGWRPPGSPWRSCRGSRPTKRSLLNIALVLAARSRALVDSAARGAHAVTSFS
jgi:hypothetical protein